MYNLHQLRATEFPHSEEIIYFNYAAISLLPARAQAKVKWAIDELGRNPISFWMRHGFTYMTRFQEEVAAFLNAAAPAEIVPATTTSAALNAIAQALPWQTGDNLLFCNLEFPSNAYPWMSLARDGVEVRQATAVSGGLTLEAIEPLVDANTRLIAASAIQFFSGHRTDLTAVGRFCRERDILFVVDAIQAIGHIKIDVQAMYIDVLASGGMKSLMALPGLGILYVRQEIAEKMQPRSFAANATVDFMHWLNYDLTPAAAAQRFANGTPNLPGIIAAVESVALINELGIENIDRHTRGLADRLIPILSEMAYEVVTARPSPGPIVTWKWETNNEAADALVAQLAQRDVYIAKHLDAQGHPYLRASFHCYNTPEEVARFGHILGETQAVASSLSTT